MPKPTTCLIVLLSGTALLGSAVPAAELMKPRLVKTFKLERPVDIAVRGNRIAVTEFEAGRVVVIDDWAGENMTATTAVEGLKWPTGLFWSEDGRCSCARRRNNTAIIRLLFHWTMNKGIVCSLGNKGYYAHNVNFVIGVRGVMWSAQLILGLEKVPRVWLFAN